MIALPEKAMEPATASASPDQIGRVGVAPGSAAMVGEDIARDSTERPRLPPARHATDPAALPVDRCRRAYDAVTWPSRLGSLAAA
jgi:hypothetical protein